MTGNEPNFGFPFARGLAWLAALVLFGSISPSLRAQEEKDEIPAPENITLETKDLVNLKCTWYAGTRGKNTVPILMLHGFGGNRNDYTPLAMFLQQQGHAVLVPDLRGHGGSTKYKGADDAAFKFDDLKPGNYQQMMDFDIERCKKFLLEKHNEEQLNIELLCVIAADMSAVLALNWAVSDWSWPQTPTLKQGQDVKALILLSPEAKIEKTAIGTLNPLKHPIVQGKAPIRLSIMIAVGTADRKANSEARTIHTSLKRFRPEPPKEDAAKRTDLFLDTYETELQGTKLLDPRLKLGIEKRIVNFVNLRLVAKQHDFKWESRKRPE